MVVACISGYPAIVDDRSCQYRFVAAEECEMSKVQHSTKIEDMCQHLSVPAHNIKLAYIATVCMKYLKFGVYRDHIPNRS